MTAPTSRTLILKDLDATQRLACDIGRVLQPGDVLLLDGPVGAGKTAFARALIQSMLDTPEDVPSPTFTLVQTYETQAGPLWHADLYRLGGPDQLIELGLFEAFETDIVLIEWPDRLGTEAPDSALTLKFEPLSDVDARRATLCWTDARWDDTLEKVAA